jgi:NAD(P)-dependent dehydrogenase (short-subunit alcohol dehydrogenase family)
MLKITVVEIGHTAHARCGAPKRDGGRYGPVKGKVAIVTVGASGIGAACATTLAREDAKVVATDLDNPRGQALVEKCPRQIEMSVFLQFRNVRAAGVGRRAGAELPA